MKKLIQNNAAIKHSTVLEMLIQKCMEQHNYKELIRIASSVGANEDDKIIILNICIAIIGQSIDGSSTVSYESYKDLMVKQLLEAAQHIYDRALRS